MVSGVTALAHMLGYESEEALAVTDFSADVSAPQVAEASAALQGAIITTQHLQKNQAHVCQGVSAASWMQTLFEPDDTIAAAASQAGLPLTVAEYYAQVHTPLRFPNLPCLTAMATDGATVLFFPLEVCKIEYAPLVPPGAIESSLRGMGSSGIHHETVEHVSTCAANVDDALVDGAEEDDWSHWRDLSRMPSAEGFLGTEDGVCGLDGSKGLEGLMSWAEFGGSRLHRDLKSTSEVLQVSFVWQDLFGRGDYLLLPEQPAVGARLSCVGLYRIIMYQRC